MLDAVIDMAVLCGLSYKATSNKNSCGFIFLSLPGNSVYINYGAHQTYSRTARRT